MFAEKDTDTIKKSKSLIYIVENNPTINRVLTILLEKENYKIKSLYSGEPLLNALKKNRADIILLDLNLPIKNGFEVCQELKADPEFNLIPIIILSASYDTELIVRAFRLGAADFIPKRASSTEILARIKSQLDHKFKEEQREVLIDNLKKSLFNKEESKGFTPICASCKKIRDSDSSWQEIEDYISKMFKIEFTHTICPECSKKLYPFLDNKNLLND